MHEHLFGFIGCGNMGRAIIKGMLSQKLAASNEINACDIATDTKQFCAENGISYCNSQKELAANAKMIFLCVKPNIIPTVAKQIEGAANNKPVVSIAAAWSISSLRKTFKNARMLRLMPNTPLMAGVGCTIICDDHDFDENELSQVKRIFEGTGSVHTLPDKLFDAGMAVSSCGCIYAYMLIESMADAGVQNGLPRKIAVEMAAQTILGGSQMVLTTNAHTAELKDAVCSPGGTTIEAVSTLENHGYRTAIIEAVNSSVKKSVEMQKGQQ